jgi:hypothetical protein
MYSVFTHVSAESSASRAISPVVERFSAGNEEVVPPNWSREKEVPALSRICNDPEADALIRTCVAKLISPAIAAFVNVPVAARISPAVLPALPVPTPTTPAEMREREVSAVPVHAPVELNLYAPDVLTAKYGLLMLLSIPILLEVPTK